MAAVIGFKGGQAGVEQLALGHDDDVEARRDLVATENLSNQSFSSISLDRAAQLPASPRCPAGRSSSAGWAGRTACSSGRGPGRRARRSRWNSARRRMCSLRRGTGRRPALVLFAADRQALAALGAAALQHQTAVLGAHPHQEPVRPRCGGACSAETCACPSCYRHPLRDCKRTVNVSERASESVNAEWLCVRVGVLRDSRTRLPARLHAAFGLSPKFSTPVEKTVENPESAVLGSAWRKSRRIGST